MGKNEVQIIVTAEDKASKSLLGIGGVLGNIAQIATGTALGNAISGVGRGFINVAAEGINMNASLEQSTMMFTTLMGDAQLAEEHVRGLFDFAAKTPFETGEIITASKHLQVFGGDALNTQESLTLIGDSAAAVGAPFDEVAFWVGRAYSAIQGGQPFGEAAMRLQEMGLMTPEVRSAMEDMQKSGADASEVWGAFEGQMGTFTGAMELQAGSWTGLMATIKDSISMASATAMKPFFDLAKQGLQGLATWFNSPATQAGIQRLATGIKTLVTRITEFVTKAVIPFVKEHGFQLRAVLLAIGVVIMASVIPAVVSLVISLAPIILVVGAIIAAVWLLSTAWKENWGGIQEKVAAVWAFLQPIFQAIIEWVQVRVKEGIEQLRAFWVDVAWPAIQRAIEIVWPIIERIFNAIKDFVVNTLIPTIQELYTKWTTEWWPTIQTVLENVWTIIEEIFSEIVRWVEENIVPIIQELQRLWVEEVWPAIQRALEAAWDVIEPIWQSLKEWLGEVLPPIINGLRTIFENVMSGIRNAIQPVFDLWNNFVGAVQDFWNWISNKNFEFNIGGPPAAPSTPGSNTPRSGAAFGGVVVNIDARGAAKGADADIKRAVAAAMREYGSKADIRMRTV